MKYLLMLASDVTGGAPDPAAAAAAMDGCEGWGERMQDRGILQTSAGLQPTSDATTVRVRGAEVLVSDGPFAETKDAIGGFALIECADLDEAMQIAAEHPWARVGQIELRPLWQG